MKDDARIRQGQKASLYSLKHSIHAKPKDMARERRREFLPGPAEKRRVRKHIVRDRRNIPARVEVHGHI